MWIIVGQSQESTIGITNVKSSSQDIHTGGTLSNDDF